MRRRTRRVSRSIAVPVRGRQVVKAAPVQQQTCAGISEREAQHVSQDEPGSRGAAAWAFARIIDGPATV